MVQFEYSRVIHPLVLFTFVVHSRVPFSLGAGKEKFCMQLVIKEEIHFSKICFVDTKWSNLNIPESYSPFLFIFGAHLLGALFFGCRKREMLHAFCC